MSIFKDKVLLITGGTGSFGNAVLRRFLDSDIRAQSPIASEKLVKVHEEAIDQEFRNEVIRKMAERGIACNVHYKPLPMMTAYKNLGFDIKDYPNAYRQFENEVTLPLHTRITDEDVEYVIGNFVDIISRL